MILTPVIYLKNDSDLGNQLIVPHYDNFPSPSQGTKWLPKAHIYLVEMNLL